MTLDSTTSKVQYTQSGTTTAWPVPYKFLDNEDLIVITTVDDVDTTLVLDTDYTVTGAGDDDGGTVTISPAVATGTQVTIYREINIDQPTELTTAGGWFPKVHEAVFDRLTMIDQQLQEQLDRSVKLAPSTTLDPDTVAEELFEARDDAQTAASEAEASAIRAEIASSTVAYYNHEGTLLTGEDTISLPWAYDTSVGVEVFLSGVKQTESSLVFTDAFTVTLDTPVSADTPFEAVASSGARSDLSSTLAGPGGSSLVGFLQAGTGAVARTVEGKLRDVVSVKDFGAVGDGVTDDTAAVIAALTSGLALDWGNFTYRTTAQISVVLTSPIRWLSNDATLYLDSASSVQHALYLTVPEGQSSIVGRLTIDANLKAFIGLRVENSTAGAYPSGWSDFHADALTVKNVYRASTAFAGGDGIWVRGAFRVITLDNPTVENCRMAAGAGISGSQGIFGITFSGNTAGDPQNCTITNPYVASVLSEDNTYYFDQDAIRVITTPDASAPSESSFKLIGGTIRNAYGRGVKIQCEHGTVIGTKFVRTQGFDRGYGNQEIDFQEGGGTVENIECVYNGSAPSYIVNFSGTRLPGKVSVPLGSINGIKATIHSGTTLGKVWSNAPYESSSHIIRVRNVEVVGSGTLTNVCRFNADNSGTGFHLLMSDIVAAPIGEWVVCGSGAGSGSLKGSRLIHMGASAAYLRSSTSGNFRPYISVDECINFIQATSPNNLATPAGVIKRIPFFGVPDVSYAGLFRTYAGTLADGANVEIPSTGASSSSGMMLVNFNINLNSQALIGVSSAGAAILAQASTTFVAGTTADPGTGTVRVWKSTNGYTIQNNSGATRNYMVVLIG